MRSWESDEAMSVAISVAIHAALVIVLLFLVYHLPPPRPLGDTLMNGLDRVWEEIETAHIVAATTVDAVTSSGAAQTAVAAVAVAETPAAAAFLDELWGEFPDEAAAPNPADGVLAEAFAVGGGLEGRTGEHRGRCLDCGDINGASEGAIEAALQWIALHQCPRDGGWSFHTQHCDRCLCRCLNSGTHGSRVAATSLALLAFLGAGHTAQSGPYALCLQRGFRYLTEGAGTRVRDDGTVDLSQDIYPPRYINAMAALALSEGYAMGGPDEWKAMAQGLVLTNVRAQNPRDGGWGYSPMTKTRGDISITGWQMMALKSGRLAGIHVPQETLYRASAFLNAVADDGGRHYNYVVDRTLRGKGDGSPATCTAIGLLLRQYLGVRAGNAALDAGIADITAAGVSLRAGEPANLFQYYYAALAKHHYGGSSWATWYGPLRDALVETQHRTGHERGSWFFASPLYGDPGGRLLDTVLAVMILETPYRYMPLYDATGR